MTITIRSKTEREGREQSTKGSSPGTVPTAFYRQPISERARNPKSPMMKEGYMSTEIYYDHTLENVATAVLTAGAVLAAGVALKILSTRLNRGN